LVLAPLDRQVLVLLPPIASTHYYEAVRVRGATHPSSQEVCLNYFFTHVNLGGTVGVGSLGSSSDQINGGACEDALQYDSLFWSFYRSFSWCALPRLGAHRM
jgi:hypothetical protein